MNVVSEMIAPLVEEAHQLRAVVQADGAQRRRESRQMMAIVVVALLMVAGLGVLILQDRQRRAQNAQILRQNAETSRQIADCTTAGGKCYEQSQRRSAAIVGNMVESNLLIARCAKSTSTAEALDACVAAGLAKPRPAPSS